MFNSDKTDFTERSLAQYVIVTVKGMAMGAADIVPGVSGGTIALITGIYQEFLSSLKSLTPAALKVLWQQGFWEFWRQINGSFLLALFTGILISLKTFASIVSWALENHPLFVWAGFSGLILASLYCLFREQEKWHLFQYLYFFAGAIFVVFIAIANPTQAPGDWWMLFIGGFIAICAMILPGISGSFILLLLGLYQQFVSAIERLDFVALGSFAGGCICGLLVFSRFLSWLLARFYTNTLATMMGFLLGSLYVTWPWKVVVTTTTDRHGDVVPLVQNNVLPMRYNDMAGADPQVWGVLLSALIGISLVLLIDFLSKANEKSTPQG